LWHSIGQWVHPRHGVGPGGRVAFAPPGGNTLLSCDYLVKGAGAMGMAAADVLLAETDA
jgi:NADPH-dependent 2,4-dienoyl-CoA reductase/sulfur reductase-like enzyme